MNKLKRYISLLLISVSTVLLLNSCSSNTSTSLNSTQSEENSQAETSLPTNTSTSTSLNSTQGKENSQPETSLPTDQSLYFLSNYQSHAFSKEHNIIVFLIDRLDYDCITDVLEKDPDFFNKLDGFTSYTNAISEFARTIPAANHILTGYEENVYIDKSADFLDKSWLGYGSNILEEMNNAGYEINIYSDIEAMFGTPQKFADNVSNMNWDTNDNMAEKEYKIDEIEFAKDIENMSAQDEKKHLKFYHFLGAHTPYILNSDGSKSEKKTSRVEQTMGCFSILYKTFDKMKELGIYKDSEIIIVADHGEAVSDSEPVQKATAIGLFHKPSGSSDTPLEYNNAPVSHKNIPSTILRAMGVKSYMDYGTPLDTVDENSDPIRYFYKSIVLDNHEEKVVKYAITGDAKVFSNWKIIEEYDAEYYFY